MMSRMAGVLLMTIGIVSFISGFILYRKPGTEGGKINVTPTATTELRVESEIQNISIDSVKESSLRSVTADKAGARDEDNKSLESLERAIEMAIADGVITENEKKVIKRITEENNLDYKSIIRDVEAKVSKLDIDSETELINVNKKNGDEFEKFVVQKFNKKFFRIKEWAGDKFVDGRYAQTTLHPDLIIELRLGNKTDEFSVECKWRKDLHRNGGVGVATEEQIERYKKFERERGVPVFIAVGIGGKSSSPEKLHIVPLQAIETGFISESVLYKYRKNVEKDFYFDDRNKLLK